MNSDITSGRSHPITIVFSLGRVLYLIVIPVSRGVIAGFQGGFSTWASGAWADALVLLFMLAFAVLSWRRCTYEYDGRCLAVGKGIFFSQKTQIPWEHICTLSGVSPFYLRPFRAAVLRADTIGGDERSHDIDIPLRTDAVLDILKFYRGMRPPEKEAHECAPEMRSIAEYALFNSNSFAGIIFISTFISQAGKLLGEGFSERLIGSFEELSRASALVEAGLPPVAAAVALALLLGWLIAFVLTMIRYHGFRIRKGAGKLWVSGGLFTKREYIVDKSRVNFVDMRQTLVSKLLGRRALYICAPGYASRKDDIACLIPTRKAPAFTRELARFFPEYPAALSEPPQLKPCPRGWLGYLLPAICFCIGALALSLYIPVLLMLLAPGVLLLVVRWTDFRTGGIGFLDKSHTLRYSRGFQLHTVVIPDDKIAMAVISRSIFQRFNGRCNLVIYSASPRRRTHICRNMAHGDISGLSILKL